MSETKQTLEDEAQALQTTLYNILHWDTENVIPDELSRQAHAALRPQFAPASVNADLLEACEAHQVFEKHSRDCADCEEWGAGNCSEGNRLYYTAHDMTDAAIAKARG